MKNTFEDAGLNCIWMQCSQLNFMVQKDNVNESDSQTNRA